MSNESVWAKILTSIGHEADLLDRSGCVPVYDASMKTWRIFRNVTLHQGAENVADPARVDGVRINAKSLVDHYPGTIEQLERYGARVKTLLNQQITTYKDVVNWAESLFNVGPSSKLPSHVHATLDLAYDDFVIEVKSGREAVYVIPASPRDSDDYTTLDFSVPGSRRRYGPRHEYSRTAFAKQVVPKPPRYRGKTVEGEPHRPRGRPRKDGLIPGSAAAKRADTKKEKERMARRATRLARQNQAALATRPRRPLVRVGTRAAQAS